MGRKKKSKVAQKLKEKVSNLLSATINFTKTSKLIIPLILICGLIIGLGELEKYVRTLPVFTTSKLTVELHSQPAWMSDALAKKILRESFGDIKDQLKDLHRKGDNTKIIELLAYKMRCNPWVKQLLWVRRTFGAQYVINCTFRQPIVTVQLGKWWYLIDEHGYILPGKYSKDVVSKGEFIEIRGFSGLIPQVGKVWRNPDLQAGLKIVRVIYNLPFKHQIKAVDVSNFNGRINPATSWISLITNRDTIIHWGRPIGEEKGLEITAKQKLALLMGIYKQFGHIDFGRAFVDIRRSPTEVDVSIASAKTNNLGSDN